MWYDFAMKYFWICLGGLVIFFVVSQLWLSHFNAIYIETPLQNEVLPLENPQDITMRYGELAGYPHMYEFSTTKEVTLAVSVAIPDTPLARNNISVIILSVQDDGSVKEVGRLKAKEASWEAFYEPVGGDRYRRGGSLTTSITPGLYRVEISTPDNVGRYALFTGNEKATEKKGYLASVHEMYAVKTFFGKPLYRILESPLLYIPLTMLILILCVVGHIHRREYLRSV